MSKLKRSLRLRLRSIMQPAHYSTGIGMGYMSCGYFIFLNMLPLGVG